MSWQTKIRPIVDVLMIVSMPVLMAYELVGDDLHEYLGIIIFLLFVFHHILNFGWIKGVTKGHYTVVRFVNLIVNFLLFFIMLVLPISGIMMSKHFFAFLDVKGAANWARTVHLLLSYWGFLLMSLHLGLHWNALYRAMRKKNTKVSGIYRLFIQIVIILIMVYGIYAFIQRGFMNYLFLRNQFVFLDFSEPLIYFFFDYFAIMEMATVAGHYFMAILHRLVPQNRQMKLEEKRRNYHE